MAEGTDLSLTSTAEMVEMEVTRLAVQVLPWLVTVVMVEASRLTTLTRMEVALAEDHVSHGAAMAATLMLKFCRAVKEEMAVMPRVKLAQPLVVMAEVEAISMSKALESTDHLVVVVVTMTMTFWPLHQGTEEQEAQP